MVPPSRLALAMGKAQREATRRAEAGGGRLVMFDMDRTLVRRDTASLYVQYQRDRGDVGWLKALRVGWWMLQYSAGVIDAERVAEKALRDFAGRRESWLEESCRQWFADYVRVHICQAGRDAVECHRRQGDSVMIVTGASRYAAQPLADELGIKHVVCTRLEVDAGGCFTGRVIKPMCYASGKVELAEAAAKALDLTVAHATFYSDSITDLPLLQQVAQPVVINPDVRLRRYAKRRGWPIERW